MPGKFTKRVIEALRPGETIWDSLSGFGARRQKDAISYFVRYRAGRGRGAPKRYYTIGKHGAPGTLARGTPRERAVSWTPDTARIRAMEVLSQAEAGRDPALSESGTACETLAQLCDLYLDAATNGRILDRRGRPKKPSTLETDAYRVEAHIKKLLGKHRVVDLTRASIESAMQKIAEGKSKGDGKKTKLRGKRNARGGRGTATRTIGLLGGILSFGVRLGIRADNPASGIRRYADEQKKRRLTDEEFRKLGFAIAEQKTGGESIAHLLAVTGWRRGEAVTLRWSDVDLARKTVAFSDTKTGRSIRPLSLAACAILQRQPKVGSYVFPSQRHPDGNEEAQRPAGGFPRQFMALRKLAGLPNDVTPHVLRHSFGSVASDMGYSDATIGALLGHRGGTVTRRYTHAADTVLAAAADRVASTIEAAMGLGRGDTGVVAFEAKVAKPHPSQHLGAR